MYYVHLDILYLIFANRPLKLFFYNDYVIIETNIEHKSLVGRNVSAYLIHHLIEIHHRFYQICKEKSVFIVSGFIRPACDRSGLR